MTNSHKKAKPGPPTQRYLDIAEIREDCVIMKDGTLRAVLMVSSINFALKSVEEQQATIQAYMQFLNGLEYPIQIAIQSRKMNIDKYMAALDEQERNLKNDLLRSQIAEYKTFVHDLVELGEIMQKRFYVVVPYDPISDKQRNFWTKLSEALSPARVVRLKRKQFLERRHALMQRVEIVRSGLSSMSLSSGVLDTQSLIELYYNVYNPDIFDTQKMGTIGELRVDQT